MPRIPSAGLLVLLAGPLLAADPVPPAGSWKFTVRADRQPVLMIVALSQAEGKWVADFIDATARFPKDPKFSDVAVAGESVKFTVTVDGQTLFTFDGVLAKDGKKIGGTIGQGGGLELVELKPTKLKKLNDSFDIMREVFDQTDEAQSAYDAATVVLSQAAAKKMSVEDVRGMLDRVGKLAAGYGPRWERTAAVKFAGLLADQTGMADAALAQARRAERLLTDADDLGTRLEVTETLAKALTKANKADDAKPYTAQVAKLEARDYADYTKANPPFAPEAYKGRKALTDRVILVEVFSGAEFPPSAAFDLARDAVLKAYKPTDVLVLNYHVPIANQGDPLAAPDSLERFSFYADTVRRGGLGLVAGKAGPKAQSGMSAADSKDVFNALARQIEEQLEKPAGGKLTLTATADPKGFAAKATFADVESPEKVALRFAVVEDRVRYPGGNGVRYHHRIVRAMPGGAKGYPLKGKAGDQSVTVSPADIRTMLGKFLDDFARESEFPRPERPLALTGLRLVAFLQNDTSAEVLTAAEVELK